MLRKIMYSLGALAVLAMAVGAGLQAQLGTTVLLDEALGIVGSPRHFRGSRRVCGGAALIREVDRKAYPIPGGGLPQFRYEVRCRNRARCSRLRGLLRGGVWMRAKLSSLRHLLFTAAALATLALAAGARYKPK